MSETAAYPPIASREDWTQARLELLAEEKALTKRYDALNAKRRRLPMVKIDKEYRFNTAEGEKSLLDLFGDKTQLIVYHFMFAPDWEKGCMGCTGFIDALGDLSELAEKSVAFVVSSRAPLDKLQAYKQEHGWDIDWVSTVGSEFNVDFGVTVDPAHKPTVYNYKERSDFDKPEEMPGTSVFFRIGDEVYHTYSVYARGGEGLTDSYRLLDITPYGRQQDFEDSPAGWPQKPTYG